MKNDVSELRGILFDTLRGLKNKEEALNIERVRLVVDTAQAITATAKVEVDFMKVSGAAVDSEFIGIGPAIHPESGKTFRQITGNGIKKTAAIPGGTLTTHRMR